MKYSTFTIVLKDGGTETFTDDRDNKVIYDLKFDKGGGLLVEKCDGNHLDTEPLALPSRGGSIHQLMSQLEGLMENAVQHEHKFVTLYAPGTWLRVNFSG